MYRQASYRGDYLFEGTIKLELVDNNSRVFFCSRYIFIEHPFQYSKVIEKRTRLWLFFFLVFPAILLIALFCVTFCQPIMHHLFYIVPALIILFICLVAIVFMYSSIFITARSHHRKLAVQLCNGAAETQKNFMVSRGGFKKRVYWNPVIITFWKMRKGKTSVRTFSRSVALLFIIFSC